MFEDFDRIKRKKRQLSPFLCKELLYDYVSGNLDNERTQAVEDFLKTSKECQKELEDLKQGLSYADKMSQVQLSQSLLERMTESKSFTGELISKYGWSQWPEPVKWGVETLAITCVVVMITIMVGPKLVEYWPKAGDEKILLAQVDSGLEPPPEAAETSDHSPAPVLNPGTEPPSKAIGESQEEEKSASSDANKTETASPAPTAQAIKATDQPVKETAKPATEPSGDNLHEDEEVSEQQRPAADSKPMKGFLYRAFMELEGLDALTGRIADDITALGGEKAGEVELGWRKPKGSYYHFTLPEPQYDQLVNTLKNYGSIRIYKDSHPRVMPDGVIRLILWIEDASLKK